MTFTLTEIQAAMDYVSKLDVIYVDFDDEHMLEVQNLCLESFLRGLNHAENKPKDPD